MSIIISYIVQITLLLVNDKTDTHFPFGKQIREETIDSFLKVKITCEWKQQLKWREITDLFF